MPWMFLLGLAGCDREGSSLDAEDVCDRAQEVLNDCSGISTSASPTEDCVRSLETCSDADLQVFLDFYDCFAGACDVGPCVEIAESLSEACLQGTGTEPSYTTSLD